MPATFNNHVIHMTFEGYLTFEALEELKKSLRECHVARDYLAVRIDDGKNLMFRGSYLEVRHFFQEDGRAISVFVCPDEELVAIQSDPPYLLVNRAKRQRWSHVGTPVEDIVL